MNLNSSLRSGRGGGGSRARVRSSSVAFKEDKDGTNVDGVHRYEQVGNSPNQDMINNLTNIDVMRGRMFADVEQVRREMAAKGTHGTQYKAQAPPASQSSVSQSMSSQGAPPQVQSQSASVGYGSGAAAPSAYGMGAQQAARQMYRGQGGGHGTGADIGDGKDSPIRNAGVSLLSGGAGTESKSTSFKTTKQQIDAEVERMRQSDFLNQHRHHNHQGAGRAGGMIKQNPMYATTSGATYNSKGSPSDTAGPSGGPNEGMNNNPNYQSTANYYNQNAGIGTRGRNRSQTLGGTMGGPGSVQYGEGMRTSNQNAYRRDQTAAGRFNTVVGQNNSDRERATGAAALQQQTSLKPSYTVPPQSEARVTDRGHNSVRGSNAEYGRALYNTNSAPTGGGASRTAELANNFNKMQQQAHQQSAVMRAQNAMHNHRRNPLW